MFQFGEALIDDAVHQVSFQCDLGACKGACCCIEGGRGAPLREDELAPLRAALPAVMPLLSDRSRTVLAARGPYDGVEGDRATTCIENRECVFVVQGSDGIARCAFELAHERGVIDWRKPISCHLFPLRIRRYGTEVLRYEVIEECAPALRKGKAEQVPLVGFLRSALVRHFGEQWYTAFHKACSDRHHALEE